MDSSDFPEQGVSNENLGRAPIAIMGQSANGSSTPRSLSAAVASIEERRMLPTRHTKADTMENDYVQFIFYCNPTLSYSIDTTELRKGFQSMPKTDGKTFNIFTLFGLIQKWESKEIETWSQLVIDMGVAPPDVTSGQSTQKVQQYAVRLKRWLHAYHIDAFFQYCLGKSNPYYTEEPTSQDALTSTRDGVPPEEDLALRALVPGLRPKRGRRPNDDGAASPIVKRQLRAASLTAEERYSSNLMSAHPQSASPWDRDSNQRDPWAAAHRAIAPNPRQTPVSAQQQPIDGSQLTFYTDLQNSSTHPQSAISPRPPVSAFPTSISTPQSAHPGSARTRKRHGPSVSAAWSSDHSSGGKLRGRPPSNRTVQDGPFSTFPAKQTPPPGLATPTSGTPGSANTVHGSNPFRQSPPSAVRKPSKLQLQVPQHAGGPVRLATPPPKVLLNGLEGTSRDNHNRRSSADFFNTIDEDPSEVGESEAESHHVIDVDWKKKAAALQRRVKELEAELRNVKRRVLEAVM